MNAPCPASVMRALILNCGPIAHLENGASGPLQGRAMCNAEELIHGPGMGMLLEDGIISKITESEELQSEFSVISPMTGTTLARLADSGEVEVWDCSGLAVIPGLIDSHSHLFLNDKIHQTCDLWMDSIL